jgi:hypothetical protein
LGTAENRLDNLSGHRIRLKITHRAALPDNLKKQLTPIISVIHD